MLSALLFLIFSAASVSADSSVPKVLPADWRVLNESADIQRGLQAHYQHAESVGRVPYVYIYSDRHRHCRAVRAMKHRSDLQSAFSDVSVVMVDYYHWRDQYPASTATYAAEFTPSLIRIAANGSVFGEVNSPALVLYYPELSGDPKLSRFSTNQKWSGPIPKRQFAHSLVRFFDRNHRLDP